MPKPDHTSTTALLKSKVSVQPLYNNVQMYPWFAEMRNANLFSGDWVGVFLDINQSDTILTCRKDVIRIYYAAKLF